MLLFNNKIDLEILIYILIGLTIFVTIGDNLIDYSRILILKLILITLILSKINFFKIFINVIKKFNKTTFFLTTFIISITISYIVSPFIISDFAYYLLRVRYLHTITDIFLFLSFYMFFLSKGINYKYLFTSIIIPGLIYAFLIFIKILIDREILNNNETFIFFDGYRQVGMLFTFYTCFYLGFIYKNGLNEINLKKFLILIPFLVFIFIFKGRGSLLSILVTFFFLIYMLFIMKENLKKNILYSVICFVISYFVAQLFLNYLNFDLVQNLKIRKNLFVFDDRYLLWEYSFMKYIENPFFGKGPGGFFISAFNDKIIGIYPNFKIIHTQPHNFILQFLIEWGLVGTLLILVLLGILFKNSLEFLINRKAFVVLTPGLSIISLVAHGLVDGSLYHPTFTFFICLSLSLLCFEISKD